MPRDIIDQFLRETALICVIGAALGLLFGGLLAYLIATFAGWPVAWAPLPVLLSASICAAVGLAFGVYPARQAAGQRSGHPVFPNARPCAGRCRSWTSVH
jgi:putative ABC transport system permease protein